MTRSYKKRPHARYTTAKSEKRIKIIANRRERHAVRQALHIDSDRDLLPHTKEFGAVLAADNDERIYLPGTWHGKFYSWLAHKLRK